MNTNNTIILNFIERMVNDGYSESRISKVKSQMNKLLTYIDDNDINEEIIISFVKDNYNFDFYNPTNHNQLDKIKYFKNLLEFMDIGNYLKRHSKIFILNDKFNDIYKKYEEYLNTRDIKPITRKCKLIKTKLFLINITEHIL